MANEDYDVPDPWGYKTNPYDQLRKNKIIEIAKRYGIFERALDIGCGEGWITAELPAKEIFGIEQSEKAKSRLPENVKAIDKPKGVYDLIVATGVMYDHYAAKEILKMVERHAAGIFITCNILEWEIDFKIKHMRKLYSEKFLYREFTQHLRVYEIIT